MLPHGPGGSALEDDMASRGIGKAAFAGLLIAVIALTLVALVTGWLSLELLRDVVATGSGAARAHPVAVAAIFFLVVLVATTLCFPAAPLLGMSGGALFGLWSGMALVLVASSIGSTIACMGARFLFRDWIARRFAVRLARIDAGLEQHGAAYLLALRFNPVIPYWPVNLAIGCTHMPLRQFLVLTLVGLAPSILVYALAGTHLHTLNSLGQAASGDVMLALLLLSLVPVVFERAVLRRSRSRA